MTPDGILEAVTLELTKRGVPATLEHPGYIAVNGQTETINWGTANGPWEGDLLNNRNFSQAIKTITSSIPGDSSDVQAIADLIASHVVQAGFEKDADGGVYLRWRPVGQ
jgi:hypothetical protein